MDCNVTKPALGNHTLNRHSRRTGVTALRQNTRAGAQQQRGRHDGRGARGEGRWEMGDGCCMPARMDRSRALESCSHRVASARSERRPTCVWSWMRFSNQDATR